LVGRPASCVRCGAAGADNVVVGNTRLLLNNGMRLGSTSPYPTDVNYVAPGKIPILNNSPVVVLRDGKLVFVFRSPGGETIGQTEFQMLVNLIDFGMPVQQAIEAQRFVLDAKPNFYKPGAEITVQIENRVPPETIPALKAMGHKVTVLPGWGSLGHVQAIRVDPKTGTMMAGGDPPADGVRDGLLIAVRLEPDTTYDFSLLRCRRFVRSAVPRASTPTPRRTR
jgi:gamma-glutamyltranspeptidase/glutathione hydrolase